MTHQLLGAVLSTYDVTGQGNVLASDPKQTDFRRTSKKLTSSSSQALTDNGAC